MNLADLSSGRKSRSPQGESRAADDQAGSSRVRRLASDVIDQIKAGEIVERPASIVKELVENALDAEATDVSIELLDAGKRLIRITDNGCGMGETDLRLCLERHATSKLRSVADLEGIASFGFRGEALPSIRSVADVSVRSRPRGGAEAGLELDAAGGAQPADAPVKRVAMREGTEVSVKDLFSRVPARLKFLKSAATEFAHIQEFVIATSLAFPGVSFRLLHNGRTVLDLRGKDTLEGRVRQVLGPQAVDDCVRVDFERGSFSLKGYFGLPEAARATPQFFYTFVNGRLVKDRHVRSGILQAYVGLLVKGLSPSCVSFLACDPAWIDVNVHPAKTEIRFKDPLVIQDLVVMGVQGALKDRISRSLVGAPWPVAGDARSASTPAESTTTPHGTSTPSAGLQSKPSAPASPAPAPSPSAAPASRSILGASAAPSYSVASSASSSSSTFGGASPSASSDGGASRGWTKPWRGTQGLGSSLSSRTSAFSAAGAPPAATTERPSPSEAPPPPANLFSEDNDDGSAVSAAEGMGADAMESSSPSAPPATSSPFPSARYLGQFANCYLLFETPGELLVVDQHAFHERILFEDLMREFSRSSLARHELLAPLTVPVSRPLATLVGGEEELFKSLGFSVEVVGGDRVALHAVPAHLELRRAPEVFDDVLQGLAQLHGLKAGEVAAGRVDLESRALTKENVYHLLIATVACHSAVRAGDPLSEELVRRLTARAGDVDFVAHCPHGRPVFRRFVERDVAGWFLR